jgi:anaerobic ribonucleoside-triphosphate reductase
MYNCHDCQKEIEVKDDALVDASFLVYKDGDEEITVTKCNDCYKQNPSLTNFRKTEVYSRVVGYIRPVNQWHTGKQEEYNDRKDFKY